MLAETDLAYYSGDDALNLPWLAIGAVGFVSVVGHVAAAALRRDDRTPSTAATSRRARASTAAAARLRAIMSRTQGVILAKAALDAARPARRARAAAAGRRDRRPGGRSCAPTSSAGGVDDL